MKNNAMRALLPTMLLLAAASARGAVGCDLNDPDRDVKRQFPDSTGYRTTYAGLDKLGGAPALARVEARLGDSFHGLFETIDVPYTIYEIRKGQETLGWIHGVNQKGQFGGIQVFLALDPQGTITAFFIQKITSRAAKKLRDPEFAKQFVGLSLKDFESYDPVSGKGTSVRNPAPEAETDFLAVLRAAKKNLVLMDEFVFSAKGGAP